MFGFGNDEEKSLKCMIIGNDNILRVGYCNKNEGLAFGKYIINADAIFLTEDQSRFSSKTVPTIAYYENDVNPIMRGELAYKYNADQVGDAVSMAAWALAKLLIAKDDSFENIVKYLLIGCLILGAGSLYMEYNNMQKLNSMSASLTGLIQPDAIVPTGEPSTSPATVPANVPAGNPQPIPIPPPPVG